MITDDTVYAYAVGRVRALETRLLDRSRFERMIDASTADEAIKVLAETDYSGAVSELTSIYDFERLLATELQETYQLLLRISPRPVLIEILALRYDVHNLRVLFKAKYMGVKSDLLIPAGSISPDKLDYAVNEEDFRDFPPLLRRASERVVEEFSLNRDPQMIDLLLDGFLFEQLIASALDHNNVFLKGLFVRQVDLINLRTLMRVKLMDLDRDFLKKALLPQGLLSRDRLLSLVDEPAEALTTAFANSEYADLLGDGVRGWLDKGSASRLEKLSDDYITAYLKPGKWAAFGLAPLVAFLWSKEIELKNIRLVLVGKINQLPAEAIRERLRNV